MAEEVEMTPISSDELPPKAAPFGASAAPAAPMADAVAAKPATIRLKPVIRKPVIRKPGEVPAAPSPVVAPVASKKTTQSLKSLTGPIPAQATLKKTGIIAEGILTPAQQQAAKSKTSRISLESAIGVAPVSSSKGPAPLKTIRLRRPVDLNKAPAPTPFAASKPPPVSAAEPAAPTMAPVSPVEDSTAAANAGEADAAVTQKKTLKLHRPGAAIKRPSMGLPSPEPAAADGVSDISDISDIPTMEPAFAPAPAVASDGVPGWLMAITLVTSIAALLVLGITFFFLYSEGCGDPAGANNIAFMPKLF